MLILKEKWGHNIFHWTRWNGIGIVNGMKIIRETDEWSSAEETKANFQCYKRWRETFHDLVNVHDCNNGIRSIHGKELAEQLSIHRKHKRSHTHVRHIHKIVVWTRWHLWLGNNRLGKSFMEILVIDCWRKSSQSSTHEGPRLFRTVLCFGKIRQIGMVQSISKLQKLWQNRWWANVIRVEYLPRIHHIAAQSKDSCWDWMRHQRIFFRKDYLHVDVERHLMGIERQQERMRVKYPTRFPCMQ